MAKKRYLLGPSLPDQDGRLARKTSDHGEGGRRNGVLDSEGQQSLPFHREARSSSTAGPCFRRSSCRSSPSGNQRQVGQRNQDEAVTVHVLGNNHKITTSRHRFEMIQMEPVSDRVKAVTLKVAVYEGDEPVTNIETVTFDSSRATWKSGRNGSP